MMKSNATLAIYYPVSATVRGLLYSPLSHHGTITGAVSRALICVVMTMLVVVATAGADAPRAKVGLVLEGGGALGFAHVGVLKVLEENRVPVDLVTGTSIGSIIGAAYASGVPLSEMEQIIGSTDWDKLFDESAPREETPFRFKSGRRREIFGGTRVALGEGGVVLAPGIVSGQKVLPLLQRIYGRVPSPINFDELPLPFRAVAADIETGQSVIPAQGDLASVVRASMSVPGFFSPVELDGRWLVDGGITNNLPIDVAQSMGAEKIIAVEFLADLAPIKKLSSPLSITGQVIDMLLEQNSKLQYKNLREGDLLLNPDVRGFGAGDFNKAQEIMRVGEAAARALVEKIRRFSVSEEEYARFRQRRERTGEPQRTIRRITVDNDSNLHADYILQQVGIAEGEPFDRGALESGLQRLFNEGQFSAVNYRAAEAPGATTDITLEVRKKAWYDQYVRLGVAIEEDFEGSSDYRLAGNYRNVAIGDAGAYSDIEFEIGRSPRISGEYYQPFAPVSPYFIAPGFSFGRTSLNPTVDGEAVAEYHHTLGFGGIALGRALGRSAEFRVGYVRGKGKLDRYIGDPELANVDYDIGDVATSVDYDSLDTPDFPTAGFSGRVRYLAAVDDLGSSASYEALSAGILKPIAIGNRTTLALGGDFSTDFGERPTERLAGFGGFLDVSGYSRNSLIASEFRIGRALLYHRFSEIKTPIFGFDFFAGASLEYAHLQNTLANVGDQAIFAGSTFIGVDTPVFPVYFALGYAEEGNVAVYLNFGRLGAGYR